MSVQIPIFIICVHTYPLSIYTTFAFIYPYLFTQMYVCIYIDTRYLRALLSYVYEHTVLSDISAHSSSKSINSHIPCTSTIIYNICVIMFHKCVHTVISHLTSRQSILFRTCAYMYTFIIRGIKCEHIFPCCSTRRCFSVSCNSRQIQESKLCMTAN